MGYGPLRGTYGRAAIGLSASAAIVAVSVIVPTFAEATPPKSLRAPEAMSADASSSPASGSPPSALFTLPLSKGVATSAARPRVNHDEGSGCGRSFHPPIDGKLALRSAYRGSKPKSFMFCPGWSGYGHVRGRFHGGIDVSAPTGTPVRAGIEGTLVYGNNPGGFGKFARVQFQHPKRGRDGTCQGSTEMEIVYAHLTDDSVKVGAPPRHVRAGEIIGKVGCTGNAKGMCSPSPESHVHVTVQRPDARVRLDPVAFLGWSVHKPDESEKSSDWSACGDR